MPDPSWSSSPPEVNYLRLAGPGVAGTATTVASAAAWQALAIGDELASSASSLNAIATAVDFEGVGGLSSTAAVTGLNTALQMLAGWAQEKPPIAASAVSAYETAVSSMIPAAVSIANRTEQAADVALNPLVLGALTPAIVALDAAYFGEHWPQNAAAGAAYGFALGALAAALAVPPPLSPPGASAAAPAAAAQSAAQAVAGGVLKESGQLATAAGDGAAAPAEAAGQAGRIGSMMQPIQSALGAIQPAMGMFQTPVQAAGGMPGLLQSMTSPLGGLADGVPGDGFGLPGALVGAAANPTGPGTFGAGAAGGAAPGATVGGGGPGGGIPGAGLTNFTRPTSSFPPESGGRPVGLKTGLLSAGEQRGPTAGAIGASAMPVAPPVGPSRGKDRDEEGGLPRARVVVGLDQRRD